ncbi:hypothetical protein O0I10_009065 [Lichtheimia ornata]|uniref:Carbohydrate esterase family 16 protein n=1 Tax=Lichtheimia ornata TaxID=688661 RepID=A0AAD7UXC4_9FUNG|nr:uncharacterized protein O0I10_009065 [Lichtheimia ornata]KAJ8655197.1 hypothetical protein O0I10_009065 [Lichtheimia ornata]
MLVFLTITCSLILACHGAPVSFLNRLQTLFSFGDSYTTQNLDTITMSYACANCTSAGGPNWVEYLVEIHPMQYWNLAYNSAPISNNLVDQPRSPVIDMATQITELYPRHFVNTSYTHDPSTTLYTFWIGINDINQSAEWNDTSTLDDRLMAQYRVLLRYLESLGAKHFMLINVPPIDRSPMWSQQRQNGLFEKTIRKRVQGLNSKLAALHQDLKDTAAAGSTWMLFDAWSKFTHILDHPQRYGLTNTTGYCPDWNHPEGCGGSIEEYFWFNDLHPTFKVHEFMAKAIADFLS